MVERKWRYHTVTSRIHKWKFLDGYSCKTRDKDHFLRHLGHRFANCCTMYELNCAYAAGELGINIGKRPKPDIQSVISKKPNVVDEYWGTFGYILEINHGTIANAVIEKRCFVNDTEAHEWVKSCV